MGGTRAGLIGFAEADEIHVWVAQGESADLHDTGAGNVDDVHPDHVVNATAGCDPGPKRGWAEQCQSFRLRDTSPSGITVRLLRWGKEER